MYAKQYGIKETQNTSLRTFPFTLPIAARKGNVAETVRT